MTDTIGVLLPTIARQLTITQPFGLRSGLSEIDADTTVADLVNNRDLNIYLPSEPVEFQLWLALGNEIPRVMKVTRPASDTLGTLEAALRRSGTIGVDDAVEFKLLDKKAGAQTKIGKDRTIGRLPFESADLAVATPGGATASQLESSLSAGGATTRYWFILAEGEQTFELKLKPTDTVFDVKTTIMNEYGADRSDITLLFKGKALRDQFILDRLRIGKTKIVVYMKPTKAFTLETVVRRT